MILSTHIVEDVADLCPAMAVMASGRILREGAPTRLMDELQGRVWKKTVDKSEIAALRERYDVISTRLFGGRTVVHIAADHDPEEGFVPHAGGLEDVYFSALHANRRAA